MVINTIFGIEYGDYNDVYNGTQLKVATTLRNVLMCCNVEGY